MNPNQGSLARSGAFATARRLEQRLQSASEPMIMGDGRDILDANQPMCEMLRVSRDALRGMHFQDLLAGGAEEADRLDALRRAAGAVVGETVMLRGDGSQLPIRFWSIILGLGEHGVRAFSGISPVDAFPSPDETNELLRELFDESPDGKLVVDDAGRTIYVNDRHLALWDLSSDDIGVPFEGRWEKTASRLADPAAFLAMQRAVRDGRGGPFRMDMADGRVLEVRAARLSRSDGAAPGWSFSTRDFTAELRAHEALGTQVALLEAVSSNSPDGILVVDTLGKPLHYNEKFLDLWGLEPAHFEDPLGARIQALFSRVAHPEALLDTVRSLRNAPEAVRAEFELVDGRIIAAHAVPMQSPNGGWLGHAFHFRDVSAERRAERELRDSEQRYRALIASLTVGVVLQFADGSIGECNPAAERILGLSRGELLGLTSFDPRWRCVYEDGSPFPSEKHPAVITLRTGEPCRDVLMGVHHVNGALRWLLVNSEPIKTPSGAIEGTVVSFHDITEQRQGQAAILQSRTAEAFNALASGVAHKVNNSLATIVGNAYLAGLPSGVPTETVDSLTEIMAAASDATSLVRDLQALSRRERQSLRTVDFSAAAPDALAALSAEDRQRVSEVLGSGLPSVLFDPAALEQAMAGLLRNALEAGERVVVSTFVEQRPAPLPEREAAPRAVPPGRYLCFQVRDDGPGVDPGVAGRIFDPFVTTKFVGRGLGLAATAGIMATHHGFVELDSTNPGCSARLLLPLP